MIYIIRLEESEKQTLGKGFIFNGTDKIFEFSTLELPWRDNQKNISRIPSGTYDAFKRISPKRGEVIELKGTGNRTNIQIHPLNYYTHTEGCIGVGSDLADINGDGFRDVIMSKKTFQTILDLTEDKFKVKIDEFFGII